MKLESKEARLDWETVLLCLRKQLRKYLCAASSYFMMSQGKVQTTGPSSVLMHIRKRGPSIRHLTSLYQKFTLSAVWMWSPCAVQSLPNCTWQLCLHLPADQVKPVFLSCRGRDAISLIFISLLFSRPLVLDFSTKPMTLFLLFRFGFCFCSCFCSCFCFRLFACFARVLSDLWSLDLWCPFCFLSFRRSFKKAGFIRKQVREPCIIPLPNTTVRWS